MIRRWVLLGVGLVLAAGAVVAGAAVDRGLERRVTRVEGRPVELVTAAGAASDGRRPAVVVAHGFAGSGRLMLPFADTLARRGYLVALVDLIGHGANTRPIRSYALLQDDLGAVVRHVRGRPDVDPARVALLGHSLGAAAVVRFAARDRTVAATVAISLGDPEVAALRPGPRNPLLLVGALEFAGFRDATRTAARGSDDARVVVVPFTEHVGVLFADRTHTEAAGWLDAKLGHRPDRPEVAGLRRLGVGALWLVALLVLAYPLLGWLRPAVTTAVAPVGRPVGWGSLAVAVAAGVGLGVPAGWLVNAVFPVAVGGYVTGFFAVVGAALAGATVLAGPGVVTRPSRSRRWAPLTVFFGGYLGAAVVVPLHLGLTSMAPHGPRWWLLAVVGLATAALLGGAQAAAGGAPPRVALVLGAVATALVAAAFVGLAPGFVTLVTPLLVGLFVAHVGFAALGRRFGAPWWFPVPAGALAVAWPVATALPLTG